MEKSNGVAIHWFRRDLRLEDNTALHKALACGMKVVPVFIFDRHILDKLEERDDARVTFLHNRLSIIQEKLTAMGSSLDVRYGHPEDIWKQLIRDYPVKMVFTNHDYEPYALKRDEEIKKFLADNGISFSTFKDQVLFEKKEIVKSDGLPYTVYTPYSRRWMAMLNDDVLKSHPSEKLTGHFYRQPARVLPSLADMGFSPSGIKFPEAYVSDDLLTHYSEQRDIPGVNGTSKLGVHLRFGTMSIRQLARHARPISFSWLNELCWREFYMMILWNFPHVAGSCFKPAYDHIEWRNNEEEFAAWCRGETGYPIVDAGMRELNATGYMHNRVRMVVASFLTKHLLIDWRWGEAYFAKKLLDFDLSANNGGWQWAAGCGCDAAPYFRIFNPYEQTKKFDPALRYIRRWVPEFEDFSYPQPIVEHRFARERCLATYKKALGSVREE